MADTTDKQTEEGKEEAKEESVETSQKADESSFKEAIKPTKESESEETSNKEESKETKETTESKETGESKETKESKPGFEKRFTQFTGETPEEYLKQLEDAYQNSSTEGQRLSKEAREAKAQRDKIMAEVAKDPDLAKRLNQMHDAESAKEGDEKPTSPFNHPLIGELEEEWNKKATQAVREFEEAHPDFTSDDDLRKEVQEVVGDLADSYYRRTGRMMPMDKALKSAWMMVGKEDNDVAGKTKEAAASSSGGTSNKPKEAKSEFTAEQLRFAERLGLSEEDLRKYNK